VSGSQRLTVQSAFGRASATVLFTPDLDQRVLVGIIEGAIGLGGRQDEIETDVLAPFEDTADGLRGEIYLKGRIKGDRLLTLRYSSDRDTEDRLFRDIQADEYYPIYGDNSERGFDAQSSSNLFVKVEKGASYMLYGDISIEPGDPAFRLGAYRNLTTGAKAHWENDKVGLTVFAARTSQQNRQVEFPGRGISGPYDIDLTDFRDGSDQLDIIVRDKVTGEILTETRLRHLTDYVLDYFRNTIVFDSPLRQFDEDGNPISARFAYQVDSDAQRYWFYGGEAQFNISERTTAGLRVIRSDGEDGTPEEHDLAAGFVRTRLGEDGDKGEIEIEIAQAANGDGSSGSAARLSYTLQAETSRFGIEASIAQDGFAPSGSSVRPGTRAVGIDYETKLNEQTDLRLSADYVADTLAGTERASVEGSIQRELSDVLDGTLGLRVEHDMEADDTSAELLVGAIWRPRDQPNVQHKLDLSLPVAGDADTTLTFGTEYAMDNGLKEKHLVLDIAKRVKRELKKKGGYEVILTRSKDKFLELEERAMIANNKSADIFVSIHINASKNRNVSGLETYILNLSTSEKNLEVAARENMVDEREMRRKRSEVDFMLASLSRQDDTFKSRELAG
ncbi:hypothetical protein LCGC14_2214750, partial [marine sediment metagenome]